MTWLLGLLFVGGIGLILGLLIPSLIPAESTSSALTLIRAPQPRGSPERADPL